MEHATIVFSYGLSPSTMCLSYPINHRPCIHLPPCVCNDARYNSSCSMFILVNFGYRSRKIFTINCLAAALFDCIWDMCHKELHDTYTAKDQLFDKETEAHQAKIQANQKKLETVTTQLREEEEAQGDKKKDDKKGAKKGGKDAPPASPLEQEKLDLEKALEFSKNAIIKYEEKKAKLADLKTRLQELRGRVSREEVYVELVDKTGERKFIKTKLEQEAASFLSDKGVYYLCTVSPGEEEEVDALTHEGFPVRTAEEDAAVGSEEVFSVKKDDKGKKGGKKK